MESRDRNRIRRAVTCLSSAMESHVRAKLGVLLG